MNILSRLEKMKKQLNVGGEFCECPDTPKYEYIDRSDSDEAIEIPVAHLCYKCGKLVEKTVIILQGVKTEKPDWISYEQYAAA